VCIKRKPPPASKPPEPGHLRITAAPLITVILIPWRIALCEYLLPVHVNRYALGFSFIALGACFIFHKWI